MDGWVVETERRMTDGWEKTYVKATILKFKVTIKLCCSLESVKASFLTPLAFREHGFVCFPLTVFSVPKTMCFCAESWGLCIWCQGFWAIYSSNCLFGSILGLSRFIAGVIAC